MSIYLYLVLGEEELINNDLTDWIPRREKWIDSEAKSLAVQINRERSNWRVFTDKIDEKAARKMLGLMIKVLTLVLMDSTCYSFGGILFKQGEGAGIGLRASACMAKIVMGEIDKLWARCHGHW